MIRRPVSETFWQTLFYPDITNDENHFIVVSQCEQVIDEADVEKGYISKEDFLVFCGEDFPNIKESDIGENTFLVEFEIHHINDEYNSFESRRIQIK